MSEDWGHLRGGASNEDDLQPDPGRLAERVLAQEREPDPTVVRFPGGEYRPNPAGSWSSATHEYDLTTGKLTPIGEDA